MNPEKSLELLNLFKTKQGSTQEASVLLQDPDVDVNIADPDTGSTMLNYAVLQSHRGEITNAIRQLLKRGADPKQLDKENCAPVSIALLKKHFTLARFLLGLEFNQQSLALLQAFKDRRQASLIHQTLLEEVDINVFDDATLNTPLHYAILGSYGMPTIRSLLKKGAALHTKNIEGKTPFKFLLTYHNECFIIETVIGGLDVKRSYDTCLETATDHYGDPAKALSLMEKLYQVQTNLEAEIQDIFRKDFYKDIDPKTAGYILLSMPLFPHSRDKKDLLENLSQDTLLHQNLLEFKLPNELISEIAHIIMNRRSKRFAEFIDRRFKEDWANKPAPSCPSPQP